MKALKISIFIISLLAINNKLIGESNKIKSLFQQTLCINKLFKSFAVCNTQTYMTIFICRLALSWNMSLINFKKICLLQITLCTLCLYQQEDYT